MVGAFTGFMGCAMVGPRLGRFDSNGKPVDMPGHSATLVVLGEHTRGFRPAGSRVQL